jgi:signal transduction histidine kinase/CheY-like chemotaxis protein
VKNSLFSSITAKIIATSIIPAIVACISLTIFYLEKRTGESYEYLVKRGEQLAREIAALSEFALISGSTDYLDDTLAALINEPEIYLINIFDKDGKLFLQKISKNSINQGQSQELITFGNPAYRHVKTIDTFDLSEDMNLDSRYKSDSEGEKYILAGYVEIKISTQALHEKRSEIILYGINLGIAVLLVTTLIGIVFTRSLLIPIKQIVSAVRKIRKGDYDNKVYIQSNNELGDLSNNINSLATEIKVSKEEIHRKIVELIDAREAADRGNAAKSKFLARVSHELRDPLTAILGNLEILLNTNTSEYQERAICLAEKNVDYLLRQIDDILEFSLLESGQYNIKPECFNLEELTEQVANITRPKADAKGLDFSINLNIDQILRDSYIESDPIRLQQIMINVIANAIKFTSTGSVKVDVSLNVIAKMHSQALLKLDVADTGMGIAQENLSCIFEMFEQVQSPISRQYGGAGLGLSITKHLVEAMGGTINVDSKLHVGSKFTVSLQMPYLTEDKYINPILKNSNSLATDLKPHRILLVEDSQDNQHIVTAFLQNIGIEVDIANNGLEGLEKYKRNDYDIVFVDCFMPKMDGFEFTRIVREYESQLQNHSKAMLIGLTAGAHKQNIEKCYMCGMDDVITKPFYRIDIYKRILGMESAQKLLEKVKRGLKN